MRGGTIYIVKRNIKADNKHIKLNDKDNQSKCIKYLDVNNLYG